MSDVTPEPSDTIVVRVVRQTSLKTIGNLKVINEPSYARQCVRCKQSVVVSWLTEAMNANVDLTPNLAGKTINCYPMVYVCDVCMPTPVPTYKPDAQDGPHKK